MTLKVVQVPNQDPQAETSMPSGAPEARLDQPAAADRHVWHDRASDVAGWLGAHLRSPRTRLCVVGIVLLLLGVVWITSSVWTLPLIIIGIVMVVIAWVGSRLDGRFAIEWGDGGTQLEFRAQIKAPPPVAAPVRLSPIAPEQAPQLRTPARPTLDDGDVIEGEGHTVEIDVAELKSLIRAAEAKEASPNSTAVGGENAAPRSSEQRPAA